VFSTAGNLITKKRTRIASKTIKYVICLRAWGLISEADDEEEIEVIDLTDSRGSSGDLKVVEQVVHLHLPLLAERRTEKAKQQEEAIQIVAGLILKDDWEAANRRRLIRRATVLITAQKEAIEDLAREYTDI
jgi:hypothetical protein